MNPTRLIGALTGFSLVGLATFAVVTWDGDHRRLVERAPPFQPSSRSQAVARCAKEILEDWYRDARIDGSYRLRCYGAVEKMLPIDGPPVAEVERELQRTYRARLAKLHR